MAGSRGLTLAAAAGVACLGVSCLGGDMAAQTSGGAKRQAQYVGGFFPDYCRFPREPRRNGVSACCIMDLDIAPDGHVLKVDGACTHPDFLAPTQLCLSVQRFVPATQNGQPVRALQTFEYEWRATGPHTEDLCKKLKTS